MVLEPDEAAVAEPVRQRGSSRREEMGVEVDVRGIVTSWRQARRARVPHCLQVAVLLVAVEALEDRREAAFTMSFRWKDSS